MKVKIFSIYHKEIEPIINNDYISPLLVGAKIDNKSGFFQDNSGKNISNKNSLYNELTGIYWVFKNYEKIGNPDYIGFCHYRRYFSFLNLNKSYLELDISDAKVPLFIDITDTEIKKISNYDFVAPIPSLRKSVYWNYKMAHGTSDIIKVKDIIFKKHPEYMELFEEYFSGKRSFYHNMFIFRKEDFFDYCTFIFDILFELENHIDSSNSRMFISERLTGVYIKKLEQKGLNGLYLPTVFLSSPKKTYKESISEVKRNLKNKEISFLYALKPLIIFFIPRAIIRKKREKRA